MKIRTDYENIPKDFRDLFPIKVNKDSLSFLKILELDDDLGEFVKDVRKECGIPEDGFSIGDDDFELEPLHYKGKDAMRLVWIHSLLLTRLYNVPVSWQPTFWTIILFNFFIEPRREMIEYTKEENCLTIKIYENLPVKKIINNIKNNKKIVNGYLKKLPSVPTTKISDIEIKNRMLELKNNGFKLSDIGNKLFQEFGNKIPFDTDDYNIVGAELSRFKKKKIDLTKKSEERKEEVKKLIKLTSKNWEKWENSEKIGKHLM